MATTIALVNQKGGCGKSSTCFHLAGRLGQLGKSVLLVDADPQGSLGQAFFGPSATESLNEHETLAAVFGGIPPTGGTLVVPTPAAGVSLIRSNLRLARFNVPEPESLGLGQYALGDFLATLAGFDFTLIDCPPNLYATTWNALVAADFALIPVPPEDFGAQGLTAVKQAIEDVRSINPRLTLLGHLVTRHDRRQLVHRAYDQKLRQLFGEQVFSTVIPEATAFKVAITARTPVTLHAPRSHAAEAMAELAQELLTRAEALDPARRLAGLVFPRIMYQPG